MGGGLVTVLVAVLGGSLGTELIRMAVNAFSRASAQRHKRQAAVAAANERANAWEMVARRTRTIAMDYGAPLDICPMGPGETRENLFGRVYAKKLAEKSADSGDA